VRPSWLLRPNAAHLEALAVRMAAALNHRGPDDAGCWSDPQLGLAIARQRLTILDLSPAGHQPMHSASGRYVVAFNGEIYNHLELCPELERTGLQRSPWRGHSDTETLLAAIEAWGLETAMQR
jgi:asparagine synthase (glutamine-hydrolysing)